MRGFSVPQAMLARPDALDPLLAELVRRDEIYLAQNPATPPLYASGVRYVGEPPASERWLTVPEMLAVGHGDCEDTVSWRVAELRAAGERGARAFWVSFPPSTPNGWMLYHVLVRRADGRVEDPSRLLGM